MSFKVMNKVTTMVPVFYGEDNVVYLQPRQTSKELKDSDMNVSISTLVRKDIVTIVYPEATTTTTVTDVDPVDDINENEDDDDE